MKNASITMPIDHSYLQRIDVRGVDIVIPDDNAVALPFLNPYALKYPFQMWLCTALV